jgi:hypothetical protein
MEDSPDMKRSACLILVAVLLALQVSGCGSNGSTTPKTPTPPPITHMYLSDDLAVGHLWIYSLPITAASIPTGTITPLNEPGELFVDKGGRLFVPIQGGVGKSINVYTGTLTSASTPAYVLTTLSAVPDDVTEDSSGNLFVGVINSATCCVDVFTGPVTGTATASFEVTANGVVTNPLGDVFGVGVDSSNNLYASSRSSIIKLNAPISSPSTPAANVTPNFDNYGLLVDASNNVYVANGTADGEIDVYTQPFTSASVRSFDVAVSTTYLFGMAFDGSGNLWTTDHNGDIWEITAPITSTSVATKILTVAKTYGIAFGP